VDFATLMDFEFEDIRRLVIPGSRRRFEARAKLRSFAIVEASLSGSRSQPAETELQKLTTRIAKGESWQEIFVGIKRLVLDIEDNGLSVTLRITKSKGQPIQLVPECTPGATVVAVKRVDELGYYSLSLTALAEKVGLSAPRTLAVIKELGLQNDAEYFKEFTIGAIHSKRYSPKALDCIKKELPRLDMENVWKQHKPSGRKKEAFA
jgi:hypothetical protein